MRQGSAAGLARRTRVWTAAMMLACAGAALTGVWSAGDAAAQPRAGGRVRPVDMASAPAPVKSAQAKADTAIGDLQRTLVARLTEAMTQGGPQAAVSVCRDEAQTLTMKIGTQHGLAIGRTSHLVRNPSNAPRAWATDVVAASAGQKVADAQTHAFHLGGRRIGVLKPIGTMPLCVTCHGPREEVQAAIGDVLTTAYPEDRAVGFAAGDLRGWFWAEVPVR